MSELRHWQEQASELLATWRRPTGLPWLDAPRVSRWTSLSQLERHILVGWSWTTDHSFDHSWSDRVLDCIAAELSIDRGAWRWQRPFYCHALSSFFTPTCHPALLSGVLVTPSRVPMRLWSAQGRRPILEVPDPLPNWLPAHSGELIEILGLCNEHQLPSDFLLWTERSGLSTQNLHLARRQYQRTFLPHVYSVTRLYQAHRDADADALVTGMVPGLAETWRKEGDTGRVHAPMIHFLRLDALGFIDLLLFELDGCSGRMIDMRWSRQPFASLILSDPYFAPVFAALSASKERLIP